jgi:hypothetical protein
MNESFIALMMEAVRTSETLVNFNVTTRRYIPEDFKLHKSSMFQNSASFVISGVEPLGSATHLIVEQACIHDSGADTGSNCPINHDIMSKQELHGTV